MKKIFIKIMAISVALILFNSCQDMNHPAYSDYKKDSNPVGGPLKFYVAFDGTTDNPLMNAVDSIRANFATDNPLKFTTGVSGMSIIGDSAKTVTYAKPNDWASTASSFTIAFWEKHAAKLAPAEFVFSVAMPGNSAYNWCDASMFLLIDNNATTPIAKFYMYDKNKSDTWLVWDGASTVTGILDGSWHHLAFVYDATTSGMTYYKDGVAYATKTWGTHGALNIDYNQVAALHIGGASESRDTWMQSWRGNLDQFRMYSTALTSAEVNALFTKKI